MSSKFVSGPINCVRLEGTVNSIKKVLYLFMDFHHDVTIQTQCEDIIAPDFKTYLINTFNGIKNKNKTYDFFFEIRPSTLLSETWKGKKEKYIREIDKLFRNEFNLKNKINYESSKNEVTTSKNFPNIRLHYVDIRDYIQGSYNLIPYNLEEYVDILWREYYDLDTKTM